jgi:hypothetical protein
MNVIEKITGSDAARWINEKIDDLPDRGKFRAASALRSLQWASRNYDGGMPIPAAYFALHATEEAVAAFVSCAKVCGYGEDAKINLKDHREKAVISLLTQKISSLLANYSVGIALDPKNDKLISRFTVDGTIQYREASTKIFSFIDTVSGNIKTDFLEEFTATFSDTAELKNSLEKGQEARNIILYATSSGLPTGFVDTEASLKRESQLTLGLIWASIDVTRNKGEFIPFISQYFRTANRLIAEIKSKK